MATMTASVGRDGVNRPDDVRLVQTLLNAQTIPDEAGQLAVDGLIGPRTIARIEAYQAKILHFSRPDGRVDPGGTTLANLSRNSADAPTDPDAADPGAANPGATDPAFSAAGLDFLKSLEGLRLQPYDDQTGRDTSVWVPGATVGYGHLIERADWEYYRDGVTEPQAAALLQDDLAPFAAGVRATLEVAQTQPQFDALVIFAYNIGSAAFAESSVAKLINNPQASTPYANLETAWMAWNKSQGKVMPGLTNRRKAEWNLYDGGVYA